MNIDKSSVPHRPSKFKAAVVAATIRIDTKHDDPSVRPTVRFYVHLVVTYVPSPIE